MDTMTAFLHSLFSESEMEVIHWVCLQVGCQLHAVHTTSEEPLSQSSHCCRSVAHPSLEKNRPCLLNA